MDEVSKGIEQLSLIVYRESCWADRRKFRAAPRKTLSLRLSSQLLLTFTRPSLTLSSAWLSSGSAMLPIPVRRHWKSRFAALRLISSSSCILFGSNSALMRSTSTENEQEVPSSKPTHYRAPWRHDTPVSCHLRSSLQWSQR